MKNYLVRGIALALDITFLVIFYFSCTYAHNRWVIPDDVPIMAKIGIGILFVIYVYVLYCTVQWIAKKILKFTK